VLRVLFNELNQIAFVFTTIYGTPFCYSGWTAFKLVSAKLGRSVMVDAVSKWTRIFGRFAITMMNTAIGVMIMYWNSGYSAELSALMLPTFIIFVFSYCIAALFMDVFDIAVESIYLCFLVDEKVHSEPVFASPALKKVVSALPELPLKERDSVGGHPVETNSEVQELGRSTTDVATDV